ncbi:hypothetical protein [Microbacterium testaceum]|uniref:hypothetical protein n=1 Tax=Microbacterium testaceum TaxID=2033 RepID=UPI002AC5C4B1|nr:hypothetical protein [Microbacterium testaceum]MDZ5146313.1 hypothetical protein [Microbacterium testaceum]
MSPSAGDAKTDRPATLKRAPRPAPDENIDPVAPTPVPAASPTPAPAPAPAPTTKTGKKRGPYNVVRIEKKPATYRLPLDVHEIIDNARNEAAARGDRLTNDEVITMAVRAFWGKKRQRR